MGNACEGKSGSHGSEVILLSHPGVWSHPHSLSLSTHQHEQLNSREAGPSDADALNYRAGPHPGCYFK